MLLKFNKRYKVLSSLSYTEEDLDVIFDKSKMRSRETFAGYLDLLVDEGYAYFSNGKARLNNISSKIIYKENFHKRIFKIIIDIFTTIFSGAAGGLIVFFLTR